jgi:hypothetical protein
LPRFKNKAASAEQIQGDGETPYKADQGEQEKHENQHLPLKTTIRHRDEQGLQDDAPNRVTMQCAAVTEIDGQGFSLGALS